MKRNRLLHAELSQVIATMGHGDMLVLRTGKCTPYANIILVAGVTF